MDAIILSVEIPKDRHLVIDLPDDIPLGQAEVIIRPHSEADEMLSNPAREAARAKLLAAGRLVTNLGMIPDNITPLSKSEADRLARLFSVGPSSLDIINQDRGSY